MHIVEIIVVLFATVVAILYAFRLLDRRQVRLALAKRLEKVIGKPSLQHFGGSAGGGKTQAAKTAKAKHIAIVILLLFSAAILTAQSQPTATPKPTLPAGAPHAPLPVRPAPAVKPALPPEVPPALKYKIIKTKSQVDAAQLALEHSQAFQSTQALSAAWAAVIQEFQKFCGDNFIPTLDSGGEPVCIVRPAPPAPAPAKPAQP
jgi:hypothetical protein